MAKFRVTIKYGNPGQYKHNSQDITVEAGSESSAIQLALSVFRNSNSTYRDKEVEVVKVRPQ